jgi:hypothetical protein
MRYASSKLGCADCGDDDNAGEESAHLRDVLRAALT